MESKPVYRVSLPKVEEPIKTCTGCFPTSRSNWTFRHQSTDVAERRKLREVVFGDPEVRDHPNVAMVTPGKRLLERFNIYSKRIEGKLLDADFSRGTLFSPFPMMVKCKKK